MTVRQNRTISIAPATKSSRIELMSCTALWEASIAQSSDARGSEDVVPGAAPGTTEQIRAAGASSPRVTQASRVGACRNTSAC